MEEGICAHGRFRLPLLFWRNLARLSELAWSKKLTKIDDMRHAIMSTASTETANVVKPPHPSQRIFESHRETPQLLVIKGKGHAGGSLRGLSKITLASVLTSWSGIRHENHADLKLI